MSQYFLQSNGLMRQVFKKNQFYHILSTVGLAINTNYSIEVHPVFQNTVI